MSAFAKIENQIKETVSLLKINIRIHGAKKENSQLIEKMNKAVEQVYLLNLRLKDVKNLIENYDKVYEKSLKCDELSALLERLKVAAEQQYEEIRAENEAMREKNTQLKQEIEDIEHLLHDAKNRTDDATSKLEVLRKKDEEMELKIAVLTHEKEELRKNTPALLPPSQPPEVVEMQKKITTLEKEIQKCKKRYEAELNFKDTEINSLKLRLSILETEAGLYK